MENFQETAIRYGEIADEMFGAWSIPGRYLVYGDKADLAALREKELELVELDPEDDEDEECDCLRCALEDHLSELEGVADIIAEAIKELDALGGE